MATMILYRRACSFTTVAVMVFLGATLSVLPFLAAHELGANENPSLAVISLWLMASALLGIGMSLFLRLQSHAVSQRWPKVVMPLGLLVLGVSRSFGGPVDSLLQQYGDSGALQLDEPQFENLRWLLGVALLREVFDFVNAFALEIGSTEFVQVTGAATMAIAALWILRRHESSVIPWFLTTSPMWLLFSLGYDEYYPFVAGVICIVIWKVVVGQSNVSAFSYVLVGILPALYIGALPISLALLFSLYGQDSSWAQRIRGSLTSAVALACAIEVGGEFQGYARGLAGAMQLGGAQQSSEGYEASGRSFFGPPEYLRTVSHLVDIWFWLSCGIGIIVLLMPILWLRKYSDTSAVWDSQTRRSKLSLKALSRAVVFLSAIAFLYLMLPLLGTTRDIDLYFVSLFSLLLISGAKLDSVIRSSADPSVLRTQIMQLASLGFAPATTALVIFGVSR